MHFRCFCQHIMPGAWSDEYGFSKPNSDSSLTSPPSWRDSAVSSRLNLNLRRQSQSQVLFSTSDANLNLNQVLKSQVNLQTKSFSRDMPNLSSQPHPARLLFYSRGWLLGRINWGIGWKWDKHFKERWTDLSENQLIREKLRCCEISIFWSKRRQVQEFRIAENSANLKNR